MLAWETLETARLVAARLRPEHLEDMHLLHRDPRVMATLSVDGMPLSDEQTQRLLARQIAHWERRDFGLWNWYERATGRFVGRGGPQQATLDGQEEVELAYAIVADCWNRGFATELGEASLAVGFERLGLASIVCCTLPINLASQRVMAKLGFTYERDAIHAGLPHVYFRLTAEEWKGARWRR